MNITLIGLLLKKKALLVAFLIVIMVGGSALVTTLHLVKAQTGTRVSGIIDSDTIWTQTNSPYNLTGQVTVSSGTVLTIEAGVTINLNNYDLQVNGTLAAQGTNKTQIIINKELWPLMAPFQTVGITFNSSSAAWNEKTETGCIIQNAIGNGLTILMNNASPIIVQTSGFNIEVNGGSPIISDNTPPSITVDDGSPTITNNSIIGYMGTEPGGGNFGLYLGGSNTAIVSDNNFYGVFNVQGAIVAGSGSPTIERNLITGNPKNKLFSAIGIAVYSARPLIKNNTITELAIGLNIYYDSQSNPPTVPPSPTITENNFENNSEYNVYLGRFPNVYGLISPDVTAVNNWWGTTDASIINQTIYDHKNNTNVGTVTFEPILTLPNPFAMPNPNSIIPAIIPSTTTSPSSTPAIPEFPSLLVILTVFIAVLLSIAVLVTVRKSKIIKSSDAKM